MAISDTATLVLNTGNYLTAVTGTACPTDLAVPGVAWSNIGHTSLEDIFGISSDGGEPTTLGTLQNKSLRTKYSARTETMAITLQQFDIAALKLFFGSNAPTVAVSLIGVPNDPVVTTCAFLAVFLDGTTKFAFYAPKVEIYRGDDMNLSDTESLAGLPLSIKPLVHLTNTWTYAVTPLT